MFLYFRNSEFKIDINLLNKKKRRKEKTWQKPKIKKSKSIENSVDDKTTQTTQIDTQTQTYTNMKGEVL